jgi:hypothetical protein
MNAGNFYRREFQPLLEKVGLADEEFTLHSLRHTFATTLAAKGVHPSTAQKMLGHSDIRMTLAIYTHATDVVQDAATDALEEGSGAGQMVQQGREAVEGVPLVLQGSGVARVGVLVLSDNLLTGP